MGPDAESYMAGMGGETHDILLFIACSDYGMKMSLGKITVTPTITNVILHKP